MPFTVRIKGHLSHSKTRTRICTDFDGSFLKAKGCLPDEVLYWSEMPLG